MELIVKKRWNNNGLADVSGCEESAAHAGISGDAGLAPQG